MDVDWVQMVFIVVHLKSYIVLHRFRYLGEMCPLPAEGTVIYVLCSDRMYGVEEIYAF